MKRKIEIIALAVIVVVAVGALVLTTGLKKSTPVAPVNGIAAAVPKQEKETTIRNVTDKVIHYSIKASQSVEEPEERTLEVGEIDRFPTSVPLEINFERGGRAASFELEAGKPYSFRYDENDIIQIYEGAHGREDAEDLAPWVPTPMVVVEKMLELAAVDKDDILYDIGCGDGRIVVTAAKKYGARGVGIDIDPQRIRESEERAEREGVSHLVRFIEQDAFKVDFSEATVLAIYLLPESNALLRPHFEKYLKPGVYVVSHNYRIPLWEHKEIDFVEIKDGWGEDHTIFLYRR
jgi:SAM-dependent methyltransferase